MGYKQICPNLITMAAFHFSLNKNNSGKKMGVIDELEREFVR
ncbi:hypothetical protein DESC_810072 [Desulfosarcina cetonica]|nr:hypothetical protein DESC_810072 [Desulfosarcina cetonica]